MCMQCTHGIREILSFPLFGDRCTYICEVQVDLDHGDYLAVGQNVELYGHMVSVPGGDPKEHPPITKKVRIKRKICCLI